MGEHNKTRSCRLNNLKTAKVYICKCIYINITNGKPSQKKKKPKKKPGHYALQILMQISVKLSFPHHELPNLNNATSADS